MSGAIPARDQEIIVSVLSRLAMIWQDLDLGNRAFLEGDTSLDRLAPLLDQRETAFETLRQLEADLLERLNHLALPGRPFDMAGAWKVLPELLPAISGQIAHARTILKTLVESDAAVEAKLQVSKENLQAQIREARRGAHLLKGYTQADPMGSCFIDKVR